MNTSATISATTVVRSKHPIVVYHCSKTSSSGAAASAVPARGGAAPEAAARGNRGAAPMSDNSSDPDIVFRLYAREIGQVGLLTPKEEVALARRIKKGDEAARELMIKANLRLVVKIAHDFEGYGLPLLDLISEGNIGLMKGVERFDPTRGAKLSTYAAFYIKQAMRRAIADHGRLIRLPVYAQEKLMLISRAESCLKEVLGHSPTDEEIGSEVNLPPSKVRRLRTAAIHPVSLDAVQGDDETRSISDTVADENAGSPDAALEKEDALQMISELMQQLPERELRIIRERFGFEGGGEKTLDEIGHELGLTRERIRQLQNNALRRLRSRVETRETVRVAA